MANGTPG
ncbi:hypothetical protein S7711_09643 [Stachybotrys chartarum IBT 7711]|nr:hypothetical protein S7711_09643 [Stachybotrys chartarum IBT 7711]